MKDEAEKNQVPFPCSDYFWGEHDERFKQFMGSDVQHEMHFHYLHGALFLFKYPPDTCKLKRADDFKELKDMIGDVINEGTMPLFVSEGSSKEKLKTIERSDYLSFCLRKLKKSRNTLVVFGIFFSKNDAHIVNAITWSKPKREIAISIHIGEKSKSDLTTEIERLTAKFKSHKISFYDSSTIFSF